MRGLGPEPSFRGCAMSARSLIRFILPAVLIAAYSTPAFAGFTVSQVLQVGKGPDGVTIADFNGDGIPDIAATIQGTIAVEIFSGNGDGTFVAGASYPVGALPSFVTSADLNGDGKVDLITANGSNVSVMGNVSILLGNGNGTFQPAMNITAGSLPFSVAVADLNGDGHLDLAVADESEISGNGVTVLFGVGDGTFGSSAFFSTGTAPASVAVGDFNRDGNPDLATANYLGNSMSVLLGNGDGTFQSSVDYHAKERPIQIVVADLNGDGFQDLVVGSFNAYNTFGRFTLFRGIGDGTFTSDHYNFPSDVYSIAVGDLDRDGLPDILVANSRGITPLFNLGGGKFSRAGIYGTGGIPLSLGLADLTGSGLLDAVVADYQHKTITVFRNTGFAH